MNMKKYEDITAYIKKELRMKKICRTNLAKDIGMDLRTLNKYLYNDRYMPIDRVLEVLDYLGKKVVIIDKEGSYESN